VGRRPQPTALHGNGYSGLQGERPATWRTWRGWGSADARYSCFCCQNNPVKHGLVERVVDWRWSSFHRYVRMGYYEQDWGGPVGKELEGISGGE
jgi:hypothetical protein